MRTFLLLLALASAAVSSAQDKEFKRYNGGDPQRQALEGKAALPFGARQWFNTGGKALDWKALRGKVVVLDFWAHW